MRPDRLNFRVWSLEDLPLRPLRKRTNSVGQRGRRHYPGGSVSCISFRRQQSDTSDPSEAKDVEKPRSAAHGTVPSPKAISCRPDFVVPSHAGGGVRGPRLVSESMKVRLKYLLTSASSADSLSWESHLSFWRLSIPIVVTHPL